MDNNKLEAILGADSKISGNLFFKGVAEINAQIEGEIVGESLITIGQTAKLKSNIKATQIVVYGNVIGDIVAKEKISLKNGAFLTGNIETPCVEIEDGATFNGQCVMKKGTENSFQNQHNQTNHVAQKEKEI